MASTNSKIYIFLLIGLFVFWLAPDAQAIGPESQLLALTCSSPTSRCSGSNREVKNSRCRWVFDTTCTYGCSGDGVCNPAPACTPSCTGDQCGQSNGCGGTCPTTDSSSCGKCGNAACCTDNGTRTCDAATPSCGQTTYGSYFDNCGTNQGSCSKTGPACTCTARSVCDTSGNVYYRNTDCSTGTALCSYGCTSGACNPAPVNGACGTNNTNFSAGSTYYTGTFCSAGTAPSPDPSFPAQGGSTTWTCTGSGTGHTDASCTATRDSAFNYSLSNSGDVSVTRGGSSPPNSVANTVTAAKSAGVDASVSFSVSGLPANATSSFSPTACTATTAGCTTTLTIFAPGAVAAGSYTVTVTGAPLSRTTSFTLTVNNPAVNGACGTNVATYDSGSTYYTGTFCGAGTAPSPNPSFPSQGGSTTWTCAGQFGGTDASCTANRKLVTPSLAVAPASQAAGGSVLFTWGAISNATYYNIQYRRDGNWGSWTNIGNTTEQNYSMSGLSSGVVAQVQACSAALCGDVSNQATATIAPAPTASLSAASTSIGYNTATTLYWSSANATACSVSPGTFTSATSRAAPGDSTGNLLASQTYTLSCTGTGGTASSQVTVSVDAPTLSVSSFSASPSSGAAPVNGVVFTMDVGGNAVGNIHYYVDCTNDGSWDIDVDRVTAPLAPYTTSTGCNYPNGGTYTARAKVSRGGQDAYRNTTLTISYPPTTVDIKAAIGAAAPADSLSVPVGGSYTLSWTTVNATACRTGTGGSWSQPNQSLALTSGAGSTARTMTASAETYPITCAGSGASGTDTITIYPIPATPTNLRITSTTPYVKGSTIAFAWDAMPAATSYVVTFLTNGAAVAPATAPAPASATTISYADTVSLNTLGASVAACNSGGLCSSSAAAVTATLAARTPATTTPTPITTTTTTTTGYSGSLASAADAQFARVPTSSQPEMYRLQISVSGATPTIAIVDADGNDITQTQSGYILINGATATFRVPANAAYYVKFTGTSGTYNYGFQRFSSFPYYQGR